MYNNIGEKIKGLATAVCIVETLILIILGIVCIVSGIVSGDENSFLLIIGGAWSMLLGPILSWISSWLLYGFGELISKATEIAENTSKKKAEKQEHQEIFL